MTFEIINKKYDWAEPLTLRSGPPKGIVEHHAAASHCTADDIHRWHIANGWCGIGYHAFISKEGKIYRGRPVSMRGGHCLNAGDWLGIVYEGIFERETMPKVQKEAGRWLTLRWKDHFDLPKSKIKGHREMPGNSTACPGRNFPFNYIVGR